MAVGGNRERGGGGGQSYKKKGGGRQYIGGIHKIVGARGEGVRMPLPMMHELTAYLSVFNYFNSMNYGHIIKSL